MQKNPLRHRPRYRAFVATSIDGRTSLSSTRPPRWTSKEDWRFFQEALSRTDAVVVGRHTYEAVAKRLQKRTTFVLSSRPKALFRRGTVTFVNPKRINLSGLLGTYKSVAILGGGAVYQYMLTNKLLDELFVTIEPLLFGRGKEMFIGGTRTVRATLVSVRRLNQHGTLLLHYQINHPTP